MKEITITDCPGGKDMVITINEEQQEKLKDLDKQGRPALESDENS